MEEALEILNKFIKENDKVVVAVSGGPDSMVLLSLVLKLNKNLTVIVAHVNHKHRLASEEEAVMVKDYCKKNDVIFEYMEINNYPDDNFHEYARGERYKFFEKIICKYKASYLLTAHHGDDLMETILMRQVRGSSLKGYAGFDMLLDKENYKILRPLIKYTKKEVEDYAIDCNIPYRIDESNNKDEYTRNRFRHHVLPFLKEEEPLVHLKFYKFSRLLSLYDDFVSKQTSKIIEKIYVNKKLNIEKFKKEEKIIQIKIISSILESEYQNDLTVISDKHLKNIINLINSDKSNSKINLPLGKMALKEYNDFWIADILKQEDFAFELNEYLILPDGHYFKRLNNVEDKSNNVIRLNSKEISLPLYIRNKKEGDKILLKGLNKHKKVKDIFIDEKIPLSKRKSYPVLTDSEDIILWIPGIKKSVFDKDEGDIIIKYF